MNLHELLEELQELSSPPHLDKMSHFGIDTTKALGIKVPQLRSLAKKIGKNHPLAEELWMKSDVHEARLFASMIADPKKITETDFDKIVSSFYSWDLCDSTCEVLSKTPFAEMKMYQYADNKDVFIKRTSFVLMCNFAVHEKNKDNDFFYPLLDIIEREAWDDRNFVRKAVNWALRQIGKRNEHLRLKAIEKAEQISKQNSKSARWIASDALRELRSEKVMARTLKK